MPIIVGLGNPGRKYAGTRHNIGFTFIETLAEAMSVQMGPGKGPFHVGKGRHAGHNVYLVRPDTYMNNSGDAVQKVLHWYKADIGDLLVCYDDLNLDIGTIRLRPGGSAGGHNGIKDLIQKLGTDAFPRLRIGIGNNFPQGQQVQYVLSAFTREEQNIMISTIDKAVDASFTFIRDGIDEAMNNFN
ncbi:MAG TPA: aminoacyl-tRNA hydrolase [Fodinibius sp.]|nr:aminoacyl-tRNA hydrolase [Fodinibius sp.]